MTEPTQASLFGTHEKNSPLRVGPAGWSYKDWEGIVYPARAGRAFDPLAFLADYFDTIEINSSFYAPPRVEDTAAWARCVRNNPRFRFTAKAWQRISHERRKGSDDTLASDCEAVRRSLAPLVDAGLLGAVLVQFPWSFRYSPENVEYLQRIFRLLPDLPLVLEVRSAEWNRAETYALLREHRIGFCNVDQPVIGRSLRPSAEVTGPVGYFRLHGRNYRNWFREGAGRDARYDYLYSKEEIGHIVPLIRDIKQQAQETYAITNNHFRGQALVNAIDILTELEGEPPPVPPLLARHYPEVSRDQREREPEGPSFA